MPEQQHRELVGPNGFRADPLPLLDEDAKAVDALAAFTTPPSGGWMMFGKHPS